MRLKCIITYRTSRGSSVSSWRTEGLGTNHVSIAADMIAQLRKRQRRRVTVIGVMVHDRDAAEQSVDFGAR